MPGAMMDRDLCDKNGLSVGDYITFEGSSPIKVIGTYRTLVVPTVTFNEMRALAAKSYVFCDLTTYLSISDVGDPYSQVDVYVDDYNNMRKAEETISKLCKEWETDNSSYYYVDNIGNRIYQDSRYSAVVGVTNTISKVLPIMIGISIIVIALIVVLWLRDHFEDYGTYHILGMPKYKIILLAWIKFIMIAAIAALFGFLISCLIIHLLSGDIVKLSEMLSASTYGNPLQPKDAIQRSNVEIFTLKVVGTVLIIEMISYFISSFVSVRLNWRTLLSENK